MTYAATLEEAFARRAELAADGRHDIRVYRLRTVRSLVRDFLEAGA